MKSPAIAVDRVFVRYHESFNPVIKDVSFTIEAGTIAMLIGPNGSGKTTLIKAMLGLLPHEGSIKISGRDIAACAHAIGYVPQTHSVDVHVPMTVNEFLHFSHANCPDYVNRPKHIKHTLKLIHADNLFDQPVSSLSGGQLQRVLFARAIMHQPKVLIMDEPEAGIDVGGEQTLFDLVVNLNQDHHLTVLIATHELDTVYHYAQQVICLNRKLFCDGPPRKVLTDKKLHQLYGRHLRFNNHNHHHGP